MQTLNTNTQHQRLKLQANGIVRFVTLSEIVYLEADDNYTLLVLSDQTKHTICKTLSNFEKAFGFQFFRCHKSYLVNPTFVKGMDKRNHYLLLTTGDKIPFPRDKNRILEEMIQIKQLVRIVSPNEESVDNLKGSRKGQRDFIKEKRN